MSARQKQVSGTAERLEQLTDRGLFERLASAVLRRAEPEYVRIIETGTNAQGEPIQDPIDGFCAARSQADTHYICIAHTTTDRRSLSGKWLSEPEGDLIKCLQYVEDIRKEQPNAKATVVLTTNARPPSGLCKKVAVAGTKQKVGIDIWDQSRLADFLDNNPDGQWLRKVHLGIDAERLSLPLLLELCGLSVDRYRAEILPEGGNPLVKRSETCPTFDFHRNRLQVLVGDSGSGKSVATLQFLEEQLRSSIPAIWIPPRIILGRDILSSAIGDWLQELHRPLESIAGEAALRLAAPFGGLVIAVDDINRIPDPVAALRHIKALVADTSGYQNANPQPEQMAAPVRLIIPLWPQHRPIRITERTEKDDPALIQCVFPTEKEAVEIIQAANPSIGNADALYYAKELNRDPFLLGILGTLSPKASMSADRAKPVIDVVDQFIDEQCQLTAQTHGDAAFGHEYRAGLEALGSHMLARMRVIPTWSDVEQWFRDQPNVLTQVRDLCHDGILLRLTQSGEEPQIVFRHDRLRDYLLTGAMVRQMRSESPQEEVVFDPYFADFAGRALARHGDLKSWHAKFRERLPLALFRSIRYFGDPKGQSQESVVRETLRWTRECPTESLPAELDAASFALLETDSIAVTQIVEAGLKNRITAMAALRNGSAEGGMRLIAAESPHVLLLPAVRYRQIERSIEVAMERHRDSLRQQMHAVLGSPGTRFFDASAYLVLLGYFAFDGFEPKIEALWRETKMKADILPAAIWAACRCPAPHVDSVLPLMLDELASVAPRESSRDWGPREEMVQHLSWAFRHQITEEATACLLRRGESDESLKLDIARTLEYVNNPDAVEYVLQAMSDRFTGWDFRHKHVLGGIGDSDPVHIELPRAVTIRLGQMWHDKAQSEAVRRKAFTIWLYADPPSALDVCRDIGSEGIFSSQAIQYRIKKSDLSVVSDLPTVLSGQWSSIWWSMLHRVWCPAVRRLIEERIAELEDPVPKDFSGGRTNEMYFLSEVLVKIPPKDADEILGRYWPVIGYSPLITAAAFRIGMPTCLKLAVHNLSLCPNEVDVFKHTFMGWGRLGGGAHPSNPITVGHLENLRPYLGRMRPDDLRQLAWVADRRQRGHHKLAAWIREHVAPLLDQEWARRIAPDDEKVLADLEQWADQKYPALGVWLERFEDRGDAPGRVWQILSVWCERHDDLDGFNIAAGCLRIIGTRGDLRGLRDRFSQCWSDEFERIWADTAFAIRRRTLDQAAHW